MVQTTLRQILDQLPALKPEELRELSQAVQSQLAPLTEQQKREIFHQSLIASGLVTHIRPPRRDTNAVRQLIEIEGEPVSETIIAERR